MIMSYARNHGALRRYSDVHAQASVTDANPHHLIQLLLDAALDSIAMAKGHMQRAEVAAKGSALGRAISIMDGLRASLDHEKGGEVAQNLEGLYEYAEHRLLQANLDNDPARLDEVAKLLGEIRSAWAAIAPAANRTAP
jgi:flagellar protein FliS